jgi:hypothetical protein
MNKLSKASQDRLLSALNDIAELTNSGEHPNAAITKVASDMKIPHGHIQLLVNAYNTGRTTVQRQSSDNVWDKAAEFPIAETDKILENMYPDKIKTAEEQIRETEISPEYSMSPMWLERRQKAEKRAAKIDWKMVDKPKPYEREDNSYFKARSDSQRIEHSVKEARYRAAYVFDKAVELKEQIKELFKTGSFQYPDIRNNSVQLYGEPAQALFDQIVKEAPSLTKQASSGKLNKAKGPIYDLVHQCMEMTQAYQALYQDYQTKQASSQAEVETLMRPFVPGPKLDPVLGLPATVWVKEPKAGLQSKSAGFFSGLGSGWSSMAPKPSDTPRVPTISHVARSLSGLTGGRAQFTPGIAADPGNAGEAMRSAHKKRLEGIFSDYGKPEMPSMNGEHESVLKALNAESTLSELLAHDDILKHHDPHAILDAYSSLSHLAPRATSNKEILRNLLRTQVQSAGGHAVFDAKGLVDLEKGMGDLARPEEEHHEEHKDEKK